MQEPKFENEVKLAEWVVTQSKPLARTKAWAAMSKKEVKDTLFDFGDGHIRYTRTHVPIKV